MSKRHIIIAAALGGAALAAGAPAAEPGKPLAALQQCRTLTDAAARLACYDRAIDTLTLATASGETVVIDREQVRKARKGLFGFAMPKIPFLTGRAGNAQDAADEVRLETTVSSSRQLPYGKWRFTVESGAVWETVEASSNFDDPRPGAKVLIERGSLGSYFAKVGKGRRVQAKRVG